MDIVALDIGGTSIKSGLFSNDLLLESFDNPTYGNKGLEKIKESICIAINHYLGKRKIDYIAISKALSRSSTSCQDQYVIKLWRC